MPITENQVDMANAVLNVIMLSIGLYQQISQKDKAEVMADIVRESMKTDDLISQMKG